MRILFITRKFPPSVGGMELFAKDLSSELSKKAELTLVKWGGSGKLKAVLFAVPYLTLISGWKLATGKIDVIHVQDGLLAPSGYLLSRLFRRPFTVVIHGLDITYQNPVFKTFVPWTVGRADKVFCISQPTAEEAIARGVHADKIRVITLAVQDKLFGEATRAGLIESLKLDPASQILLTVGRLEKRKGVSWFVESVLPELVKKYPRLIYLIAGDGKDRAGVELSVKKAAMAEYVRILGRVDDNLLTAAYNGADVFVMPNIVVPGDVEGFGLVVLEASLCELPIVASALQGIKDAITDAKNGMLVNTRDAEGFIGQISTFLADSKNAKKFGHASREFTLKNYNWDVIAQKYVDEYAKVIR